PSPHPLRLPLQPSLLISPPPTSHLSPSTRFLLLYARIIYHVSHFLLYCYCSRPMLIQMRNLLILLLLVSVALAQKFYLGTWSDAGCGGPPDSTLAFNAGSCIKESHGYSWSLNASLILWYPPP